MRLIASPTSPYVRKVRIAAIEKGLMDRISMEMLNPLEEVDTLARLNPLGKVPALVLPSGEVLFDSLVICDYLDQLESQPSLLPPSGQARFEVLTYHALAHGVIDAAVNSVMERRRPEAQQSAYWLDRWRSAIQRGLEAMNQKTPHRSDAFDLGAIAAACALGYLQFRLPDLEWPEPIDALRAWWDQARTRPSILDTAPPI